MHNSNHLKGIQKQEQQGFVLGDPNFDYVLTLEMALKSNGGAKHCTVNSGVVTTRRHN
jgi:hypothetical protein